MVAISCLQLISSTPEFTIHEKTAFQRSGTELLRRRQLLNKQRLQTTMLLGVPHETHA